MSEPRRVYVLVVFLKGMNVGGHRSFRPAELARELRRLDVVSVGAAGTFVVRSRVGRAELRTQIASRIPFSTELMIRGGGEVLDLVAVDPFANLPARRETVRFVSVMAKLPKHVPHLPDTIPETGRWGVRVLGRRGAFVFGVHRREMKAIGYLAQLEKALGASLATRSWSTIMSVANLLPRPKRR